MFTKREVGRERKEGGQRKGRSTQGDRDHEVHGIIIEGRIAELFKKESTLNVIKGWGSIYLNGLVSFSANNYV